MPYDFAATVTRLPSSAASLERNTPSAPVITVRAAGVTSGSFAGVPSGRTVTAAPAMGAPVAPTTRPASVSARVSVCSPRSSLSEES